MSRTLRILFLEDTPEDAELSVATLEEAGYTCNWERVETREDFLDRLKKSEYDLVLSDYSLPSFDGISAAKLFVEHGLDIPFILISGTLGEEAAVESLKAGATDFVLKTKMFRLPSVVERALREAKELRQNKRAEQVLRVHAAALDAAANGILVTAKDGTITWVNPAFTTLTGYEAEDVVGQTPRILRSGEHDVGFYSSMWSTVLAGDVWRGEMVNMRKDGSTYFESQTITPLVNASGEITNFIAIKEDITERRQADAKNAALAAEIAAERLRLNNIVANVPGVVWEASGKPDSATQRADFVSDYIETMLGYSVGEWLATPSFWLTIVHPDDKELAANEINDIFFGGPSKPIEFRWITKDGRSIWVEVHAAVIRDHSGDAVGLRGVTIDVSERKEAERDLTFKNLILSTQQNTSIDGILVVDDNGQIVSYNKRFVEIWSIPPDLVENGIDEPVLEFVRSQVTDPDQFLSRVKHLYDHKDETGVDEIVLKDESILDRYSAPMIGPDEKYYGRVWYFRDVTESKLAQEAMRESEERYRLLFGANPHPMWVYDLDTLCFLAVNDAAVQHYGYSQAEFLAMTIKDIRPAHHVPALLGNVGKVREGVDRAGIWQHQKANGEMIDVEITAHQMIFGGRRAEVILANDVTERQKAEVALKEAEEKFRSIFENAVEGIFQSSAEGKFISVNPAMVRILGYDSPADLIADRTDIRSQHYADANSRQELERLLAEHDIVVAFECEVFRKDGNTIWTQENIRAVRDESGNLMHYEGSIEDITARRHLEEQFRQSQKMEAVGVLAGGIAHDFNNLLTAISGYSELTLRKMPADNPWRGNIHEIKEASNRAAELTSQLLAFSRRQVLKPRVHNVNAVIVEIEKMLRRIIRESVELRTVLDPKLGNIKADPGQIEQVIVNLAVNARDAMPNGGILTIETQNVRLDADYVGHPLTFAPGDFVRITVTDTGEGMDKAIQPRIFEPFFTTKEVGKGTGLGLSTVHGIVRQSGGDIMVYSEVGHGTTFKIFLPCVDEKLQVAQWEDETENLSGTETILLVEDEEIVRNLVREILEGCGYKVLDTASGSAALSICENRPEPIDLLLTDVIMPKMSGKELKDKMTILRPGIKILLMSGYSEDTAAESGIGDPGTSFIEKPFTPDSLARKVREVLDG